MNLVYMDATFRHLLWTGDLEWARSIWPVIERRLAWERRLFRRPLPIAIPSVHWSAGLGRSTPPDSHFHLDALENVLATGTSRSTKKTALHIYALLICFDI